MLTELPQATGAEVAKFIAEQRVARMATASPNGEPHIVAICYAFDGRMIYSAIDRKPKKTRPERLKRVKNILSNSTVALLFDQYHEDWQRLRYVLITGRARILRKGVEHGRALGLLQRKYRQYREGYLSKRALIIKVVPVRVYGWGFSSSLLPRVPPMAAS